MQINPSVPGTLTRVTTGHVGAPRVSGDGGTIVYEQWVDDQWDVMKWRDGQVQVVSDDPRHDVEPRVSADGETVVWTRFSELDGSDPKNQQDVMIWRGGETRVLAGTPADETSPAISADGRTVAWTYDDPKSPLGFDIQVNREGITSNATTGGAVDSNPIVSADGSRLFFRRKVAFDGGDMWMIDETGKARQLTFDPTAEFDPCIDAGGHTLVWSDGHKGYDMLMRCDTDSGETRVLRVEEGIDNSQPALSADGRHLAWVRRDRPGGEPPQIMLADDGVVTPLTVEGFNAWPSISADGRVVTWLGVDEQQTVSVYRFERHDVPAR